MNFQRTLSSPIKTIVRGQSILAAGQNTLNVAISSVSVVKTLVVITSRPGSAGAGATYEYGCVGRRLTSSTNIEFKRVGISPGYDAVIDWELVQYV